VSKSACEFIMNKVGEYEGIVYNLLCKNERLKGSLFTYRRLGVSGVMGSRVSNDRSGVNADLGPNVTQTKKKLCCSGQECG